MPVTPVQRLTSGEGGKLSWKSYVPVVAAAEAPPANTARPNAATSEAQTTNLRRSGEAIIFLSPLWVFMLVFSRSAGACPGATQGGEAGAAAPVSRTEGKRLRRTLGRHHPPRCLDWLLISS